nr:testicular acid phosphatase homolog [Leptinotarsa decemlineata]
MKHTIKVFVFLNLITSMSLKRASSGENDKLVAVSVIYRHGARGPSSSYPNDPYLDVTYWPNGLGQLVDEGKLGQFNLGKWLRNRYSSFLSEKYNASELLVRSTDVDRTLMSAGSNLAGLYYINNPSHEWKNGLPWDPIPIHTVPENIDEVISMYRYCKKFEQLYTEAINSDFYKQLSVAYKNLFDLVSDKTGWGSVDLSQLLHIYITFHIYETLNPSYLPDWANEINGTELAYLAGLSLARATVTKDLQRLQVGPFNNYLNNHFDGVIEGISAKFLMISGHDGTIASILNAYGAYDYFPPEFCSTLIWEIRKNQAGNHYVNIFYKRDDSDNLVPIVVDQCSFDCEYVRFKSILQPITVDSAQWLKECENDDSD